MKTYTTKQGDMWDSIAYSQLGSTGYTTQITMRPVLAAGETI